MFDEWRVLSFVYLFLAVAFAVGIRQYPDPRLPEVIGFVTALFLAANGWCGFPFHGWWKRRNLWR